MKNIKITIRKNASTCIAIIFLAFIMPACKDHDVASQSPQAIETLLQSGDWQITLFFDGKNENNGLREFVFSFKKDGTVVASNQHMNHTGNWSITQGHNRAITLSIEFPAVEPIIALNNEWEVIENSDSLIRFENAAGNNEGLQNANKLVIERI